MNIKKKSLQRTLDEAIVKSKDHPKKTYYVWDVKCKPTAMCSETDVTNSFTHLFTDNIYLFATVKNGEVSFKKPDETKPKTPVE